MSGPTITALAKLVSDEDCDDAVQLLDERQLNKLELYADEIERIGKLATLSPIKDDVEEGKVAELVSRGVIALKDLEGLRDSRVRPLNEEVKAVNALFRKVTDPLKAIVDKGGRLERLILAYRAEKRARIAREEAEAQRKQQEAAERIEAARMAQESAKTEIDRLKAAQDATEASAAMTLAAIEAPLPMTKGVRTDSGSVSERTRWVFKVMDDALVPRSFCIPDEKHIRAAVAAGVREIPGVAIYLEESLTRRSG